MNRGSLTLGVSTLLLALTAEACSSRSARSDANTNAGTGGVADDAAGSPISDKSGAGGVIAIGGFSASGASGGRDGATNGGSTAATAGASLNGAAGSAGNAAEDRWIDPVEQRLWTTGWLLLW